MEVKKRQLKKHLPMEKMTGFGEDRGIFTGHEMKLASLGTTRNHESLKKMGKKIGGGDEGLGEA